MIEIEVYAKGLRDSHYLLELQSGMDLLPKVRYKFDELHDLVFFEIDDPKSVSLKELDNLFTNIGLRPRFVGKIPDDLRADDETCKIA